MNKLASCINFSKEYEQSISYGRILEKVVKGGGRGREESWNLWRLLGGAKSS